MATTIPPSGGLLSAHSSSNTSSLSSTTSIITATVPSEHAVFSLEEEILRGQKRTYDVFYNTQRLQLPEAPEAQRIRVYSKIVDEYGPIAFPVKINTDMVNPRPSANLLLTNISSSSLSTPPTLLLTDQQQISSSSSSSSSSALLSTVPSSKVSAAGGMHGVANALKSLSNISSSSSSLSSSTTTNNNNNNGISSVVQEMVTVIAQQQGPTGIDEASMAAYKQVEEMTERAQQSSRAISSRRAISKIPTPQWHAPWKLMRVISGHQGWVRSIAVDPSNEWFATGAADRTIKIWDLASGTLKLTLTGHIGAIRGLAISSRQPYLFSVGEDKSVKCWDLETNQVIRKYIGHLSGVYSIALHPTLDIFMTGGRDSVCRVWDIRTKTNIHTLTGHENTVTSILSNSVDPQIITGSMDNTIRFWDLVAGKVRTVLTHHKHAIRSMVAHPKEFAFISGSSDHLKKWSLPEGTFVQNFDGHNSMINGLALNEDNVLVSGGDDGSLKFWDYSTGYSFQYERTRVQPGSLDSEAGIYATSFDQTGMRLITGEADKTIKIWREDTDATPETHPIDMEGWTAFCRQHKTY